MAQSLKLPLRFSPSITDYHRIVDADGTIIAKLACTEDTINFICRAVNEYDKLKGRPTMDRPLTVAETNALAEQIAEQIADRLERDPIVFDINMYGCLNHKLLVKLVHEVLYIEDEITS